jgi:hypothetical protein
LSCAVVGSGWPLAGFGAVFAFWAMQALKSGASGMLALGAVVAVGFCWPCCEIAAMRIQ